MNDFSMELEIVGMLMDSNIVSLNRFKTMTIIDLLNSKCSICILQKLGANSALRTMRTQSSVVPVAPRRVI